MGNLLAFSLDVDTDDLKRSIDGFARKVDDVVSDVFEQNAVYGTAWMKANAPWTDNTGAARASLLAYATNRRRHHELLLSHGVHYGIWLETKHNRKDQILRSAQRHLGDKIMADIRRQLRAR